MILIRNFIFIRLKTYQYYPLKQRFLRRMAGLTKDELRGIEVSDKYFGGLDTIKQIARIYRKYYTLKTKKQTTETHYIMTSLSAKQASPEELLKFSVNHWSIENNLHRTRDTHFKEDVCTILSHKSQQNNASMRNLAICLLSKINKSISLAIEAVAANIKAAFSILFRRI